MQSRMWVLSWFGALQKNQRNHTNSLFAFEDVSFVTYWTVLAVDICDIQTNIPNGWKNDVYFINIFIGHVMQCGKQKNLQITNVYYTL